MSRESLSSFPPTLIFNSVESFLETVHARVITDVGHATLRRVTAFAEGMGERHISYLLLTARDTDRDEILACSVYLHYGDFLPGNQLFTPHEAWEQQRARGDQIRRQVLERVLNLPNVRLVNATFHVHPDVALRFAAFTPNELNDDLQA